MATFFKTTYSITVLSEYDPGDADLKDIAYEIDDGDWVGSQVESKTEEISGKQAADLLTKFGSEPGFFQLDADGNPVKD